MPSLTPEEQKRLLGYQSWKCGTCDTHPYKNYCRECDEFFFVCKCPPEDSHEGHRIYGNERRTVITVGKAFLGNFCVMITRYDDDNWTKEVVEIAEFETRPEAEAFVEVMKGILKLAKPKKVCIKFR